VTVGQGGQRAAEMLDGNGFQLHNLDGGMSGWLEAGRPTA
jgi:rhodanese-related sulfurtransferase